MVSGESTQIKRTRFVLPAIDTSIVSPSITRTRSASVRLIGVADHVGEAVRVAIAVAVNSVGVLVGSTPRIAVGAAVNEKCGAGVATTRTETGVLTSEVEIVVNGAG